MKTKSNGWPMTKPTAVRSTIYYSKCVFGDCRTEYPGGCIPPMPRMPATVVVAAKFADETETRDINYCFRADFGSYDADGVIGPAYAAWRAGIEAALGM